MTPRLRRFLASLLCLALLAAPGSAALREGALARGTVPTPIAALPAFNSLPPPLFLASPSHDLLAGPVSAETLATPDQAAAQAAAPSPVDAKFLDDLQQKAFLYFWEQTDLKTGLTKDRASNFTDDHHGTASIAATGFGLTALMIADQHGWIPHDQAYARALLTLRHLRDHQPHVHGWFHHFEDAATGEPAPNSEVSSIDTALLLAGALSIGRHFAGTEVERLAEEIYARVDFPWMMTDGGTKPDERTLSMGWTPSGFLKSRWNVYSEHMILYMLGLGSPTHPLPADSWRAWSRPAAPITEASGPLFTHQYPQLWLDLRGWKDDGHDYFDQSTQATLIHRDAAVAASGEYSTYGPNCWGWTACDGPEGYFPYGAYPKHPQHDGTIAPAAAGGSAAFTPELSIAALRWMKGQYGDKIWGRYGFADAFNTDARWKARFNEDGMWRSPDVIGIDQGAILLAVENARSGGVWKNFMDSDHVRRAYQRANLVRGEKLSFAGVGKRDVYNLTAPFKVNFQGREREVLAARVELRKSEDSKTVFFEKVGAHWRPLKGAPVWNLQDPFFTKVGGEWVMGGVETFPRASGGTGYRTVFYRGKDLAHMRRFSRGPDDMKDIRLMALPNGKIIVLSRPQGKIGGRGKIAMTVIDDLNALGPAAINGASVLEGLFSAEEWGGANELHLLKDGRVGVLGHIAKFDADGNRHYYPMAFTFDPATGRRSPMKILLQRSELPPGASKRPDLADVLFSGGLVRGRDGTAVLYVGAGDAESYRVTIPDPFLD
jgi:hypothetical protein